MISKEMNGAMAEEHANELLENIIKSHDIIIIDTCSLMYNEEELRKLRHRMVPMLKEYDKKLIVPLKVIAELQKNAADVKDAEKSKRAVNGTNTVAKLQKEGVVKIYGNPNERFADHVIQKVIVDYHIDHSIVLITQDRELSKFVCDLEKNKSVRGKRLSAVRVNKYGFLSVNKPDETESKKREKDVFKIGSKVTEIEDTIIPVHHTPQEGENVYIGGHKGHIRLEKKIASGGEGSVYATNTPFAAKIYKPENNRRRTYEKLKRMMTKPIEYPGICYPIDLLYNDNREFVGYLMPMAKGKELQRSVFIKPLLQKNFPNWNKYDTVQLCVTILEKIKYLHEHGIIIGDINPANILVNSPTDVYFVDVDSYQIEEFPCPGGTVTFTAPEIQGIKYSDTLRSMGNENFAVATLLFMIMLPGKSPYAQQGGGSPAENIKKMDFSYASGDKTNGKAPEGSWRFIWSHLPRYLKDDFYDTFHSAGKHSTETTRYTANIWLRKFKYYYELLKNGKLLANDPMSIELFPTRYKKNPKLEYITCKLCGEETEKNASENGICHNCLKEGEKYNCTCCGKELFFSNRMKYVQNKQKRDLCEDCFQAKMKRIVDTKLCKKCGMPFNITEGEKQWISQKGYMMPTTCPSCREKRKESANELPKRAKPVPHNIPKKPESKKNSIRSLLELLRGY